MALDKEALAQTSRSIGDIASKGEVSPVIEVSTLQKTRMITAAAILNPPCHGVFPYYRLFFNWNKVDTVAQDLLRHTFRPESPEGGSVCRNW